jgi:hypothetical protein
VDWSVLLTPVLMLAVLLLLGFAGCLEPPHPAPPRLCIRFRVPLGLAVTEIDVRTIPPGGEVIATRATNPIPESTDGGDNVFSLSVGQPVPGTWTVRCRVTAVGGAASATATAQATFVLDLTLEAPCATFQASGSPSDGDFAVVFVGVTEEG